MISKTSIGYLLYIFIIALVTSCVNLDHINKFATVSEKILESQNEFGYSFTESCLDFDCKQEIYFVPAFKDFEKEGICDCSAFKMADKALSLINGVLNAYLTGLAKLSNGKAVNYNFDNLIKAVDVDQIKNNIPITSNEISSVSKLATIISHDLMDTYRKRKLKIIIKRSDTDFQILITAYKKCMSTYFKNILLNNDLVFLTNRYSDYLYKNETRLSPYEKGKIYEEYLTRKSTIERYKDITDKFVASLDKIGEGHAELNKESGHLTDKNIKSIINHYATDVESSTEEFNKLKKSKEK